MRVLLVYCHPVPDSFSATIRDAIELRLASLGHELRLVDLYADGFDPVMGEDERRHYHEADARRGPVQPYIDQLRWAGALVFVYPTWWYGPPAMLKGWLDRVFIPEVAFSLPANGRPMQPRLQHIERLAVITTCGAPRLWSWMVGEPGRKMLLRGLRALCHRRSRALFMAHYDMDRSTDRTRAAFLRRIDRRIARFFA